MAGSGRACGTDDSDEVKEVDAMVRSGGWGVGVDVCAECGGGGGGGGGGKLVMMMMRCA